MSKTNKYSWKEESAKLVEFAKIIEKVGKKAYESYIKKMIVFLDKHYRKEENVYDVPTMVLASIKELILDNIASIYGTFESRSIHLIKNTMVEDKVKWVE